MARTLLRKGKATREALLAAARSVFAAKGFLNTEITDITDLAGKSRATFYTYIGGKTELLLELIADLRVDLGRQRLVEGSQLFKHRRRALELVWNVYRKHAPTLNAVMQAASLDPKFGAEFLDLAQRGIENCRRVIRYRQELGYCRHFDPDIAGSMLSTMINGTLIQVFVYENPGGHKRDVDDIAFDNLMMMVDAVLFSKPADNLEIPAEPADLREPPAKTGRRRAPAKRALGTLVNG